MYKKLFFAAIIVSFMFTACDDSDDSPNQPSMPDINNAQMNTAEFTQPSNPEDPDAQAYVSTYGVVTNFQSNAGLVYVTIGEIFAAASGADPEYDSDVFTWLYTASLSAFAPYEDTSDEFDFVLTANVSDPTEIIWALNISGTLLGVPLNKVSLLTGTTSYDKKTGELVLDFGNMDMGALFDITFGWEMEDEVLQDLIFNARLFSTATDLDVDIQSTYTLTGTTAEINLGVFNPDADMYVPFLIRWDVEAGGGLFDHPQHGAMCWDADKNNIECP